MRSILKFFVFIFFKVPLFHAFDINCPYSFCGSNPFTIRYPFIIGSQKPICSHYINLTCTFQSDVVLNIPFSGDFHVVSVNYFARSLTLRDPKNCLVKRLFKLNLSSSPFSAAENYRNFTFYNCPIEKLRFHDFRVIDCLNIPPNITVVSSEFSSAEQNKFYGCSKIVTKEIPSDGEYDTFGYLKVTWNVPSCTDCEGFESYQHDYGSKKDIPNNIALAISIPLAIMVMAFLVALCKRIAYHRPHADARTTTIAVGESALTRQTTFTAAVAQLQLVSVEDMLVPDGQHSYLKTMRFSTFLEWNRGSLEGHDQGSCCTICLEEYFPQDVIRCLTSCHHYFHSKCIDKWFRDSRSCPVCRKSVFDI